MQSIFLYLLNWLEQSLDPELRIRLAALNSRIADAEAKEKEAARIQEKADAEYKIAFAYRADLNRQLAESRALELDDEKQLQESQVRRKKIQDDLAKSNAAVDARSDDERFGGVPK